MILSREPKSLTTLKFIGGIYCSCLFFIELRVNTKLLGPAMTGGKQKVMAIAVAVAALNVLFLF